MYMGIKFFLSGNSVLSRPYKNAYKNDFYVARLSRFVWGNIKKKKRKKEEKNKTIIGGCDLITNGCLHSCLNSGLVFKSTCFLFLWHVSMCSVHILTDNHGPLVPPL